MNPLNRGMYPPSNGHVLRIYTSIGRPRNLLSCLRTSFRLTHNMNLSNAVPVLIKLFPMIPKMSLRQIPARQVEKKFQLAMQNNQLKGMIWAIRVRVQKLTWKTRTLMLLKVFRMKRSLDISLRFTSSDIIRRK